MWMNVVDATVSVKTLPGISSAKFREKGGVVEGNSGRCTSGLKKNLAEILYSIK
jgi:hypothetical protein